eukprot:15475499-Alexandrium_andersonii.AAC.1
MRAGRARRTRTDPRPGGARTTRSTAHPTQRGDNGRRHHRPRVAAAAAAHKGARDHGRKGPPRPVANTARGRATGRPSCDQSPSGQWAYARTRHDPS